MPFCVARRIGCAVERGRSRPRRTAFADFLLTLGRGWPAAFRWQAGLPVQSIALTSTTASHSRDRHGAVDRRPLRPEVRAWQVDGVRYEVSGLIQSGEVVRLLALLYFTVVPLLLARLPPRLRPALKARKRLAVPLPLPARRLWSFTDRLSTLEDAGSNL